MKSLKILEKKKLNKKVIVDGEKIKIELGPSNIFISNDKFTKQVNSQ